MNILQLLQDLKDVPQGSLTLSAKLKDGQLSLKLLENSHRLQDEPKEVFTAVTQDGPEAPKNLEKFFKEYLAHTIRQREIVLDDMRQLLRHL